MTAGTWLVLGLILGAAGPAGAQVTSGPPAGEAVKPLKVFAVTGAVENKEVDYAAERKDKPTVFLFVKADKWDRPVARFVKHLDQALPDVHKDAGAVAVWLTSDVDKSKEYLPRAQTSLQLQNTALTCFPGEPAGPADWGINADAYLTAVVVHKTKVVAAFGYRSVNETDVSAVRDALKKALQ